MAFQMTTLLPPLKQLTVKGEILLPRHEPSLSDKGQKQLEFWESETKEIPTSVVLRSNRLSGLWRPCLRQTRRVFEMSFLVGLIL